MTLCLRHTPTYAAAKLSAPSLPQLCPYRDALAEGHSECMLLVALSRDQLVAQSAMKCTRRRKYGNRCHISLKGTSAAR